MTREEAIKNIKEHCYFASLLPQAKEALDVAIKVLEQESTTEEEYEYIYIGNGVYEKSPKVKSELTTKNDLVVDCISRKAAEDITWQDPSYTDPLNILTEVRDKIRELPSVTPIRPKGHWIYDKSFANWICSKCGETPKTIGYVGTGAFMAEHFKYCNHCGAEMEGSKEV